MNTARAEEAIKEPQADNAALAAARRPQRPDVLSVRIDRGDVRRPEFGDAGDSRPLMASLIAAREELERRSREWIAATRLVEQATAHLAAVEAERDLALAALAEVSRDVDVAARELRLATEGNRETLAPQDLKPAFEKYRGALERLERASATLAGHYSWYRSAWEKYCQAVEGTARIRAASGDDRVSLP